MKVTAITAYVVKADTGYYPVNAKRAGAELFGTDYFRIPPYSQLYSRKAESVIIKVETDTGITGWGESQAPVGPEIVATIVEKIVGPVLLGRDPMDIGVLFTEMTGTSRNRGHTGSYQMDAIAGLDTALWDIRGKLEDKPLSSLLGGRYRNALPSYASGLRSETPAARRDEALSRVAAGFGIKPFLSGDWKRAADEMAQLREAVGNDAPLFADGLWSFTMPDAALLGASLEDSGFNFFECPGDPEDITGHARLAQKLRIPIAIGETLRTRNEFLPWLQGGALAICQPDIARIGVSESMAIAALAETFNVPTAPHIGACTIVGMATTWQISSAIPNFLIQEHQPVMFDVFNRWLAEPLVIENGQLVVPDRPGIGVTILEEELARDVVSSVTIRCD